MMGGLVVGEAIRRAWHHAYMRLLTDKVMQASVLALGLVK
jgi:hypothetical protein